jgi:catechol 2,3-dioxygenase-like lactoylglutathione lyase family enzyme
MPLVTSLVLAAALASGAAPERPRILGVSHVAFRVSQLAPARSFYQDFLGYPVTNADNDLAVVRVNERQYVELLAGLQPGQDRLDHVALRTDDAEAMRRYLASRGVDVPERAVRDAAGALGFVVRDPEGHRLELVEHPANSGPPAGPERISSRLLHAGILVGDLPASTKFYQDLLGFTEIWRGSRSGTELSWTNMEPPDGDDYLEFMLYGVLPAPDARGSQHHICLEVPDVAAAQARLLARPYHASYARPLEARVGTNRRRQLNLFDPDGTRVELMEPGTVDGKPAPSSNAPPPAADWGEPPVTVTSSAGTWTIAGRKNTVVLEQGDLSVRIQARDATWKMIPSSAQDLLVREGGHEFRLRLADAREIQIVPYRTGFKTGVKITLGGFRRPGARASGPSLDLRLFLTLALEGGDEDLAFEVAAAEGRAAIRELNWPTAVDGREVDATVLSNDDGMLLPRDWPTAYHPIRRATNDTSIIQSHLIESWSMSWWGFQRGAAAMIVIVETPDDAAYTFSHPAGGPTAIGPSWRSQLGRFAYLRSLRMAFLPRGGYVDLAKRYRRHVMDTGHFVSLQEKIARNPLVKNLVGAPFVGARVLRNIKPESPRYDKQNPAANYSLTTFAENARRLRQLKAAGFERLNVSLSGWPTHGYDRQHPDGLPPNAEGGGWEGMRAFFEACRELGYVCWLHDQYRDYYPDAPSFSRDLAVREEDASGPPTHFPGTRFHPHDWKDGAIPFMNYWDGGTQTYLNNRYMLGHVQKNYALLAAHDIRPQGSYNDVYGYIPPDADWNPEHPSTRTESMRYRAEVCHWVRRHLGIMGTEDGADWIIPYVDYVTNRTNRNPGSGNDASSVGAIPVPLYELVYHDAVVTTYSPNDLRGFLHGNAPTMRGEPGTDVAKVRQLAALHERVGLLEMTKHEFLDAGRTRERTTFADGTTVTVDWTAKTVAVVPELPAAARP